MDFELNDDQKMLAQSVESFTKQNAPIGRSRKLRDDPRGWETEAWTQMAELGWLGLPFSEEVGGFGFGFTDVALILEKLGSAIVPEPYLASVVLGGIAIREAGSKAQQKKWLAPMIEGRTSLALAYAESRGRYDPTIVETVAEKSGDGYALTGRKGFVLNGHAADHLVVSARADGDLALFVVDSDQVERRTIQTIEGQRAAQIVFNGSAGERLEGTGHAAKLQKVLDGGAAAVCAEGIGLCGTVLGMTLEHLKTREQFGVKIGSFQALQHRAVDMFVEMEMVRSSAMMASMLVDAEDDVERMKAVSAAKAQLSMSGTFITQQSTQLHGGIGITDEHDIGLYFKRMHALSVLFGDEAFHLSRLSGLDRMHIGQ